MPAPAPDLAACVIIPARDEAANIAATLDALAAQRDLNGDILNPARFEIVLLANNCRDQTVQIARDWRHFHSQIALHIIETHFSGSRACIGLARRVLMDAACARLGFWPLEGAPRAICSTDADTRVMPFWIARTLEEMRNGAEAVGGRVWLEKSADDDETRKIHLLDTAYRLARSHLEARLDPDSDDPWPRHFQFFGASLAIRPDVYARIGGVPRARNLEDVALERELLRRDCAVRHSPDVAVWTCARRGGRVEVGLSSQLREWSELGAQNWLVPSGAQIKFQTALKRRLRRVFCGLDSLAHADEIARELRICALDLKMRLRCASFFGALWEEVWTLANQNADFRALWAPVEVERALNQLRLLLERAGEK